MSSHPCSLLTEIDHRDHLKNIKPDADSGFWVLGGAMLEDTPKEGEGLKINGSVMMAVAASKEEVLEKIKKDVYANEGVWDMEKVSFFVDGVKKTRREANLMIRSKYFLSSRLLDLLCRKHIKMAKNRSEWSLWRIKQSLVY